MLLLAAEGVSYSEYRVMDPALADALAVRAVARRQEADKAVSEMVLVLLEVVAKRLIAIEAAIARRPFGV